MPTPFMSVIQRDRPYVWQHPRWPDLTFDPKLVGPLLLEARRLQGEVDGKASAIGLVQRSEVTRDVLAQEAIATAAIEGETLDPAAVRSSVMRRLGLATKGPRQRHVDGLVEVISDATDATGTPLDDDRLCRWQSALFPGGTSGIARIAVGRYRDHAEPMQIISGMPGREVIHYQAPASDQVPAEMARFLAWFAKTTPAPTRPNSRGGPAELDGLARAAIAHVWFETIHPFEDGNGRIGRAVADMALAQDAVKKSAQTTAKKTAQETAQETARHSRPPLRLYSLSQQLLESRAGYYDALNTAQRSDGDVTAWVAWFAQQIAAACRRSSVVIDIAIEKSRFWATHSQVPLNARQRKVVQRFLDDGDGGFLEGLNAEKYMKLTGASKATATRDLTDLLTSRLLRASGRGKAMRYCVDVPGWTHGLASGDPAAP